MRIIAIKLIRNSTVRLILFRVNRLSELCSGVLKKVIATISVAIPKVIEVTLNTFRRLISVSVALPASNAPKIKTNGITMEKWVKNN
jgi:hypothetical protein